MVLVINTTDDFIEAMRRNPEFLAAARRELLTQELLDLPQKFAEHRQEFQELRQEFIEHRRETSERFDSLEGHFDTMTKEFGSIKGMTLGLNLEKTALPNIVTDLRLRGVRIVSLAERSRASEDFHDAVWDAADDGTISEAERRRLTVTDMIVRGRIGRNSDAHVYVVTEASYSIDKDDISKVRLSASALRKVFPDATVFACLYGVNIPDSLLADAADNDVIVYLEEQA